MVSMVLIMVLGSILSGCGHNGPLYMPKSDQGKQDTTQRTEGDDAPQTPQNIDSFNEDTATDMQVQSGGSAANMGDE